MNNYQIFGSTFLLIFVAELPDKTAIATLLMATRQKPLGVFIGVCLAFVVQSAIAILFGRLFSLVPHVYVQIVAAMLFFVFAYSMYRQSQSAGDSAVSSGANGDSASSDAKSLWRTIATSFMVIFIAEWGDLTQLATMALVAQYQRPLIIFVAATLALWSVTAVAILAGRTLAEKINPRILQRTACVVFAGVGCLMLYNAIKN